VAALKEGRDIATKRYRVFSLGLGTVFMLMYIGYGVAFYYGASLVLTGETTPGTVFTVSVLPLLPLLPLFSERTPFRGVHLRQLLLRPRSCPSCDRGHSANGLFVIITEPASKQRSRPTPFAT